MISRGLYTALITPFDSDGSLDIEGFKNNIRFQEKEGVDGLLILGATGEGTSLTESEKKLLLEIAKEEVKAIPLLAGVTPTSTSVAIEMLQELEQQEIDGALVTPPLFCKPTQEGIFLYFKALCENSSLPIIVYNHKGRTSVHIEPETIARIASLSNIVGVKDASGDIQEVSEVLHQIKKPGFLLFSGDDPMTFSYMALGAAGVISVASNLIPSYMKAFVHSFFSSDFKGAKEWHFRLLPLFKALFVETNPIPIKAAMNLCGFAPKNPRLPLTPLSKKYLASLEKVLEDLELLQVLSV